MVLRLFWLVFTVTISSAVSLAGVYLYLENADQNTVPAEIPAPKLEAVSHAVAEVVKIEAPETAASIGQTTETDLQYQVRLSARLFPVSPVNGITFYAPRLIQGTTTLINPVQLQLSLEQVKREKKETLVRFLSKYVGFVHAVNCTYHKESLKLGATLVNFLTTRENSGIDIPLPTVFQNGETVNLVDGFRTTEATCSSPDSSSKKIEIRKFSNSKERLVDFFTAQAPKGNGTGWATSNGLIVTNRHVIANASRVFIVRDDHDFIEGKVLYADEYADLALIKIEDPEFLSGALAISKEDFQMGEDVYTVGFPWTSSILNDLPTAQLSRGIVSSIPTSGMQYQLSMPVQQGNSGGPLFNDSGEVIGIVTSKLNEQSAIKDRPENVGFAVRSALLLNILSDFSSKPVLPEIKVSKSSEPLSSSISKIKKAIVLVVTI